MISVIVLSSDGYSDCWEPMFLSLKKYFKELNKYELILSTNTKSYTYDDLEIKVINHKNDTSWSKRLIDTLDQASNELVLLLVEDYFLRSELNLPLFKRFITLMNDETNDIDHIRLVNYGNKFKTHTSQFESLDRIDEKTKYRFMYLPGLWKKEILKQHLVPFENPYFAEIMGDYRSQIFKHGFYSISSKYVKENGNLYHTSSSGAVYKGKWKKWVIDFLKENNLSIDIDKRGLGDASYYKNTRYKTILDLITKQPVATFKSVVNIAYLFMREKLK